MKYTKKNIADAESALHHELNTDTPDPPKRNYFVPHFGEDTDIMETKESIKTAEKSEGHTWTWKKQHLLDHLKNPVPPGLVPSKSRLDDDMISSLQHADDAEASTGSHWTGDGMYK
jgi:hypothetical protein